MKGCSDFILFYDLFLPRSEAVPHRLSCLMPDQLLEQEADSPAAQVLQAVQAAARYAAPVSCPD